MQRASGRNHQEGFLGEEAPIGLEDGQGWAAVLSQGAGAGRLRRGEQDSCGPETLAKALLRVRDWPTRATRRRGSCRPECLGPFNPCF